MLVIERHEQLFLRDAENPGDRGCVVRGGEATTAFDVGERAGSNANSLGDVFESQPS